MASIKIAILGLGGMGATHAKLIASQPDFRLVAACDANADAYAKHKETVGEIPFFTDPVAMVREAQPDLVTVVTPHHLHAPLALQVLEAGAGVILEKPMAIRLEECRAMLAAARSAGRLLTVFHNRRRDPWLVKAREVVASGRLGTLVEIRCGINWPHRNTTWRSSKASSGGLLYDMGAHFVDYAFQLAGGRPVAASGHLYRRPERDADANEDHGSVQIRFDNETLATITVTALDRVRCRRFHIIGTDGTLVDDWNWGGGTMALHTVQDGEAREETFAYDGEQLLRFGWFYQELADHILRNGPVPVTPESAARVIAVLEAADRSSEQAGAWVPLEKLPFACDCSVG